MTVAIAFPRWAFFLALALPLAAPAQAQRQENSGKTFGPTVTGSNDADDCPQATGAEGEIVVCGFWQEGDQFRVQSTRENDPEAEENLKDGLPRAPNVDGPGIFQGPATVSGGCFLQSCPPPPAYIVDFDALPEAPEGSDADKIAKGEKPAP